MSIRPLNLIEFHPILRIDSAHILYLLSKVNKGADVCKRRQDSDESDTPSVIFRQNSSHVAGALLGFNIHSSPSLHLFLYRLPLW